MWVKHLQRLREYMGDHRHTMAGWKNVTPNPTVDSWLIGAVWFRGECGVPDKINSLQENRLDTHSAQANVDQLNYIWLLTAGKKERKISWEQFFFLHLFISSFVSSWKIVFSLIFKMWFEKLEYPVSSNPQQSPFKINPSITSRGGRLFSQLCRHQPHSQNGAHEPHPSLPFLLLLTLIFLPQ